MRQRSVQERILFDRLFKGLVITLSFVIILPMFFILYFIIRNGIAVVNWSFLVSLPKPMGEAGGGISNALVGTVILILIASVISIPFGILTGIYLSEYGRNPIARAISFLADVMTGVPTIIIGVFVFTLMLTVDHDSTLSALSGGIALGVLMIPLAVRTTEEALNAVPTGLRESALALGFPRHRVSLRVVLGCARGGLITGILLAVSRAAGDTATLIVTTGNATMFWYQGLGQPVGAMTPFIFNNFGSTYSNLQTDAWGASLVLLGIMLAISLGTRLAVPGAADAAEGA